MKKLIVATFLLFMGTNVQANENMILTCPITKQYICTAVACTKFRSSVTIELHIADNKAEYSRCDEKGCNKYHSSVVQSGIYTLISPNRKRSTVKIDSTDMKFIETSSLGLSAFIAFGKCQKNS